MHPNAKLFKKLLGRGAQRQIAKELGMGTPAVCMALDRLNPSHPAVQKAVKMIAGSDSAQTQRQLTGILADLAPTPSAA